MCWCQSQEAETLYERFGENLSLEHSSAKEELLPLEPVTCPLRESTERSLQQSQQLLLLSTTPEVYAAARDLLSLLIPVSSVMQEDLHSVSMLAVPTLCVRNAWHCCLPSIRKADAVDDIPNITIPGFKLSNPSPSWSCPPLSDILDSSSSDSEVHSSMSHPGQRLVHNGSCNSHSTGLLLRSNGLVKDGS